MNESFIVRRGGVSVGSAFAVISATYPVGSVCTCVNGTKTLKAPDTSGNAIFYIPEAGTWTVSCTDGVQTASKQVDINRLYQGKSVNLTYDLILFDFGDECDEITGGWLAQGKKGGSEGWIGKAPTVTKFNGYYEIIFSAQRGGLYTTTNTIDLSEWKTLKMLFQNKEATGTGFVFGAWDNTTVFMNGFTNVAAKYGLNSNTIYNEDAEVSIDVSAILGSWNVGLGSYSSSSKNKLNALKKIWLTNEG